jgi:hypothetical protein
MKIGHNAMVVVLIGAVLGQFSAQTLRADDLQDTKNAPKIKTKSVSAFNGSIQDGWTWVATKPCAQASPGNVTDQCAAAALLMASNVCSASAKFLKKDSQMWKIISVSMLVASAAFTGIGASTTLANAKIWSTLGGTTGLGAVTSSVNANVTNDQTGLASINTTLGNLITYVTTGGKAQTASAPVLTSAAEASGIAGTAGFSYQIGAPNTLSVNSTGQIFGTLPAAQSYPVSLSAINGSGTGNATLTLVVTAAASTAPVITSPAAASGVVGSPFSYQIAATNSPTAYGSTGTLPSWLSIISATGLVSGTPTTAGTSTVSLTASNAGGAGSATQTGTATVTIVVAASAPASTGGPAPNDLVFKVASLYGAQCAAVATGSAGK